MPFGGSGQILIEMNGFYPFPDGRLEMDESWFHLGRCP